MVNRSNSIWENMAVQPNSTPVAIGVWTLLIKGRWKEGGRKEEEW
jgi:hypothetical protein